MFSVHMCHWIALIWDFTAILYVLIYLTTSYRTLVSHAVNICCIVSHVVFLSSCNWMVSYLPGIVSRYSFNSPYGKHFKLKTKVSSKLQTSTRNWRIWHDILQARDEMVSLFCHVLEVLWSSVKSLELLAVYLVCLSMEGKWADCLSVVNVSTKRPPKFTKQLRSNGSCKIRNKKHSLPFTM